jgi:hypothetical protein
MDTSTRQLNQETTIRSLFRICLAEAKPQLKYLIDNLVIGAIIQERRKVDLVRFTNPTSVSYVGDLTPTTRVMRLYPLQDETDRTHHKSVDLLLTDTGELVRWEALYVLEGVRESATFSEFRIIDLDGLKAGHPYNWQTAILGSLNSLREALRDRNKVRRERLTLGEDLESRICDQLLLYHLAYSS